MNNDLQKVIGGLILIVVCIIFPPLIIIAVPMGIYYSSKASNEKQKINAFLEQQFGGKTPKELEKIRITYVEMSMNPYATEVERANAKYIVKYIEEKMYNG